MSNEILCIGEILWDALPAGLFLGGAPFNVASHLQALTEDVAFVSRVGDDLLGEEALRRVGARGLDLEPIQIDETLPTGFVRVGLDEPDEPDYEIIEPAAWDAIALTDRLHRRVDRAGALVYGSLAQRAEVSRTTIRSLCKADILTVLDVNLRPPFFNKRRMEHSLRDADVVKLNDEELDQLRTWFGLPNESESAMAEIARAFECVAVCVTWGADGARLWTEGTCWHHPGYAVEVEDTVGAGDAFLAAFLSGLLAGREGKRLLDMANRLGAYVASHSGAVPAYSLASLSEVADLSLTSETETA